jgi:hypothetical protein
VEEEQLYPIVFNSLPRRSNKGEGKLRENERDSNKGLVRLAIHRSCPPLLKVAGGFSWRAWEEKNLWPLDSSLDKDWWVPGRLVFF